ncbi:unnamed protein product [marine sediment metagenome]|uniref:Uncharacterized protein n=1 Tax=marine sediment metagenome TaxID=412755 RepID=X1LVY2_9ZZZZ
MDKQEPTRIICLCPKCGNDKLKFGRRWTKDSTAYKEVKKCFVCSKCNTNFEFEYVIYEYENMVDREE